jgi:hypothetical protein
MGTKSMDPLEAKIAIGRRRKEKVERLRREGSSEDYWEMRTYCPEVEVWRVNCREPLQNAFPTDPAKMTEEEKNKRIL